MYKNFHLLVVFLIASFASATASAGCRFIGGAQPEVLTPSITEMTVDPSVPDRTQIGPELAIWSGLFTYMYCDASPAYTQDFQMLGAPIPGSNGLYATNVPGIAYAVAHSYYSVLTWFPFSRTYTTATNWTIEPHTTNPAFRLRFFKYGKLQYGGGTINPATIARYVVSWSGGMINPTTINLPGIVVKTPACVISDTTVDMGSISAYDPRWQGVGTRGPDVPFNFSISGCSAGFTGIAFTLTPVTTLLSSPDWYITLDGASTAADWGCRFAGPMTMPSCPSAQPARWPSTMTTVAAAMPRWR